MNCPRCGQYLEDGESAEGCRDLMCPVPVLEWEDIYEEEEDRYDAQGRLLGGNDVLYWRHI